MNKILISLIESLYIIFMYNFFKTKISFHHLIEVNINKDQNIFFKHPIYSNNYENKICTLGSIASYFIASWFLIRNYNYDKSKIINKNIITIIFFISLISNLNSFIYIIPIFIIEYFMNNY